MARRDIRVTAGMLMVMAAVGCGSAAAPPAPLAGPKPPPAPGPAGGAAAAAPPVAEAPDRPKSRSIIGKTTQDIRDAQAEQAAGAVAVTPKITGEDPITIAGSAYVSIIGRAEVLSIQHAVDIHYNINGRYPKDLDEFMRDIIKPNNIRLAKLPHYQAYGYDSATHQLVILEYPNRR